MHRVVSMIGSALFQLVFAAALAGGVIGVIFCLRDWEEAAKEDTNILPAALLLAVAVAICGLIGIVRFRDPSVGRLDVETSIAPLRARKPISNAMSGAVALVVGIVATALQLGSTDHNQRDLLSLAKPIVLICVGLFQLCFGIWQVVRLRSSRPPRAD